ncbi:MAG: PD40 domain-containing protein [Chloroflexota bacterium]|nr:MAG: PD40 domain-containing protein [Chloroflexota bacterium]
MSLIVLAGCSSPAPNHEPAITPTPSDTPPSKSEQKSVPHVEKWGIYALDLATEKVELLYGSASQVSHLSLNKAGDRFAFSQKIDGDQDEHEEICTVDIDGGNFQSLTNNSYRDLYPVWSSDDAEIAFLSWRDKDLDIYLMSSNGTNVRKLYDSGHHDADINWQGNSIVFTSNSRIWMMRDDGTQVTRITEPPRAGQWGNANLPFGDYDPRLSPNGNKIVFERLEDDSSPHGNYNIYVINSDGSGQNRLTATGYSQGLANWSSSGDKIVYVVAAIGNEGKYDIYMMNSDGTNVRNITPDYFPAAFLCHTPVFSIDDSKIFFVGQWWE